MSRSMMAIVLAVSAPLFAGTASAQGDLVQKGQKVFTDQKCAMCHSIAGKGNAKGSLDNVASQFKPDELRQWIVSSKEMAAKHDAQRKPPMKDFSGLPKDDVDALVAYLSTLK